MIDLGIETNNPQVPNNNPQKNIDKKVVGDTSYNTTQISTTMLNDN